MEIISKLYLTKEEKEILAKASRLLEEIADSMSFPWRSFNDDEIMETVEIISDILELQ